MNAASVDKFTSLGNSRVELVDALRGSALAGILLLHSIEHWDFSRYPENASAWLKTLNTWTHDCGFFFFGGKSYAVFALMFGVSFSFILNRWSQRGVNFKRRFLWRLALLGFFGYINGIVYCGDFLMIIAILGMPLVFLHGLSNRALAWLSVLLVLQIPSWWQVGRVIFESGYQVPRPYHWGVYDQICRVYGDGSLWEVIKTNLWLGQTSRLSWTFETGRYTQMLGLFVWGYMLGRSRILENPERAAALAVRALFFGAIGFAIIYPVKGQLSDWGLQGTNRYVTANLVSAYCNLAQLAIWVGAFVLLFQWTKGKTVLRLLAPYGRMSLSNYVLQGLIGVPLFYGFGWALYRYLGPFYSVQVGAAILVAQIAVSRYWLKRFHYGPLEWLWRALTFGAFTMPMRKPVVSPANDDIIASPSIS